MAALIVYQCDVCPHTSESATGFLTAIPTTTGITFAPGLVYDDRAKIICGQGCAAKLLSQIIEGWNNA